jgi:DNA/RNA endonuclease YhcR with UshA esterase domain
VALGAALIALTAVSDSATPALTVGKARAKDTGATVTIVGHVSVAPGAFKSALSDEGFAVQDASGGVYVKMTEKQAFAQGAKVSVTGTLDEQNKLRILKAEPAGVKVLKGTKEVAPKKVGTGAVNESVEGQLIKVTGKVTQTFTDDSPYGYKLYINDGSGEIQIFSHVSAGIDKAVLEGLKAGQEITVVGLAAQYETTYEVAPRRQSDITVK